MTVLARWRSPFFVVCAVIFSLSTPAILHPQDLVSFQIQPSPGQPQTCSGPLSGLWLFTSAFHGTCVCGSVSSPISGGGTNGIDMCQEGSNLTSTYHFPFDNGQATINVSGTVNGNQVKLTFTVHLPGIASCEKETEVFTGTLSPSMNSVAGNLSLVSDATACTGGNTCHPKCNATGAFTVAIGGSAPPSVTNVSQSSGIANQNVATTGVQWIDYNGDKKLDLFLVGTNGTALFKNIGAGKFTNVTVASKITNNGRAANGASWADIDNDGDLDVFIANQTGSPTLLLNNHGIFTDISSKLSTGIAPGSAPSDTGTTRAGIWVDINNDKDIDLFIVKDGGANQLFRKTGLTFTNIASSAGLAAVTTGRSAIAFDADSDGYQDLFVVNFNHPNKLYLNKKNNTFSDISSSAGVSFSGGSVQAAVADYDRDKDPDLFVVNNNGSSILYKNLGTLKFAQATPSALKGPKKGIAAAFADIDMDGNQDLILAQTAGGNMLFQNSGKGAFTVVRGVDLSNPDNPTGVTVGDFNGDGLPDIAIGDGDQTQDRGDSLYQNSGSGNNYLQLTLVGTTSNKAAIGARVIVQTGLTFQAKEVTAGNGSSQGSLPLNFGLGVAQIVDTIQIYWPGGAVQTLTNIKANTKLTITQKP